MQQIPDPAHTECFSCAHHRKREGEIYCHRNAPVTASDGTAQWPRVTEAAEIGCSEYVEYAASPYATGQYLDNGSAFERGARRALESDDCEQLNKTFY